MYIGNANIIPHQPRLYLYHAYLAYMEAQATKIHSASPCSVRDCQSC